MQSNEMEFELSPSILNTPSLMTPNLLANNNNNTNNPNPMRLTYSVLDTSLPSEQETHPDSNPSSIPTTVTSSVTNSEPSSSSSSDVKLSRIEEDLKKSLQARQPTPSPFASMATVNGGVPPITFTVTSESSAVPEVPSTADVRRLLVSHSERKMRCSSSFASGRSGVGIVDQYVGGKILNETSCCREQ